METTNAKLEAMAKELVESGQYQVVRKLQRRTFIEPPDGSETHLGLFVDVETTGLDLANDRIIELAMVPFTFSSSGRIFEIRESFQELCDPHKSIPAEITALTGITDEMVKGRSIDPKKVDELANGADLVLAHNAFFDRRFLERKFEIFKTKEWGCSMTQVDWSAEGYEGTKLVYLAMGAGFFYDRHRAENDCIAAIELLAKNLPNAGVPAMAQLLRACHLRRWRIWAVGANFSQKDSLKARGYHWRGEARDHRNTWYVDLDEGALEEESTYLRDKIYKGEDRSEKIEILASNRFSERI